MSAKEKTEKGKSGKKERSPLYDASRRVVLAAIGAAAIAQEEVEEFVDRLVERGEIAEKDGKKLMREVMEKRKERFAGVEDELGQRVQDTLARLNVPTKKDIDNLAEKLADLANKVDEIGKPKE